jgi:aminoglycoside phosphotransferase (APT) family kinase protein
VNAIYRLGDRPCARLPRMPEWEADLEREWRWLPRLAPHVTLRIPEPVERGRPDDAYPFAWAIFGWIEGRPYADDLVADERGAATGLARFVRELRGIEAGVGVPPGGRRPLRAPRRGHARGDRRVGRRRRRRGGDGTWERARGYALHQAAMIIRYYAETNPDFVAIAARTVQQVLADVPA